MGLMRVSTLSRERHEGAFYHRTTTSDLVFVNDLRL